MKKPKSPVKKTKAPDSDSKRAETTKAVLEQVKDRQTTDSNN